MKCINFTTEEEFITNTDYYSGGFESKLYRYSIDGTEILIKKYYETGQINLDKIIAVSNLKTDGLLGPSDLVLIDNKIVGFSMDFKKGYYPIITQKNDLTDKQKYDLIIALKKILLSLRAKNCIYGDLNLKNVITNGSEVCLCDAVNVKIDDFHFDEVSSSMRKYIERTGTTDGIDFYMLNLLTIWLFNDLNYDDIIDSIELAVMNTFNKQSPDYIVGVTDSMDSLDLCCDVFLSDKPCRSLLIDLMDGKLKENEEKSPRL